MKLIRKILFPIVPIYWLVTWLRNKLYDLGIKKSVSYNFPLIAVGNISVGGTGKTPMVEYLIRMLKPKYNLGTLSRGYGRKSKGFVLANKSSTALDLGDEPMQFHIKYPGINVAVDGDRRRGLAKLFELQSPPDVVLLDDAFQHRKVNAGFYILLTSYQNLYSKDIVLPTGNLREPRSGAKRADIIVVTKCPQNLTNTEKQRIKQELSPNNDQQLFFATITYSKYLYSGSLKQEPDFLKDQNFTLLTGIANPQPFIDYYKSLKLSFEHLNYPDHYNFTDKDIRLLKEKDLVVTTEKDYMRLKDYLPEEVLWYHPIKMQILDDQEEFQKLIFDYIKKQDP